MAALWCRAAPALLVRRRFRQAAAEMAGRRSRHLLRELGTILARRRSPAAPEPA